MQKRASIKYHSHGLWTNTCCSHANQGEEFEFTIHDRFKYEMDFDCKLDFKFVFQYRADFENGLIENEIDHVYFGYSNQIPNPNPDEVDCIKWESIDDIVCDMRKFPKNYTYRFRLIIERVKKSLG